MRDPMTRHPHRIATIPGGGIGGEVVPEGLRVGAAVGTPLRALEEVA